MTPFERGLVAHLVADWLLQNDWMARHKMSLRHPASWCHSAIQGICLGLALDWRAGLVLSFLHLLIDTYVPVSWWMRYFKKCTNAPGAPMIALGVDQTLHIVCIALWVTFVRA